MIDRKIRTAMLAVLGVAGMTGLGFASVPLYQMFCQVTGLNGTTNRGDAAPGSTGEKVIVKFDSNVSPSLPWQFQPEQRSVSVDIGGRNMAFFTARNTSSVPITGTATFNVTPAAAGQYFTKIQCFCFTQQTLQPGQEVRMPVIYYVDPKLHSDPDTKDVQAITLSYTFYPSKAEQPAG